MVKKSTGWHSIYRRAMLRAELVKTLPGPAGRRSKRKKAGLTLEAAAEQLGITKQRLAQWEAGSNPQLNSLRNYADWLSKLEPGKGAGA